MIRVAQGEGDKEVKSLEKMEELGKWNTISSNKKWKEIVDV